MMTDQETENTKMVYSLDREALTEAVCDYVEKKTHRRPDEPTPECANIKVSFLINGKETNGGAIDLEMIVTCNREVSNNV